jgi:uncharacterized phage-associated protein
MADTAVPDADQRPAAPEQPAHVLDIAAHLLFLAWRDGTEMTVAKLHFLCYQVQAWSLAWSGQPAFAQSIYAEAEGIRIDEIRDAYAAFGDRAFTLQDAVDAGIVAVVDGPESPSARIQQ